jgi:hypothetical protein
MPRSRNDTARTLADNWFPPVRSPAGEVGHPLICVASTYTFHAPFFESDLLPRFLGLKSGRSLWNASRLSRRPEYVSL